MGRFRVHQPRPRGRAARRLPRRDRRSSSIAGSSRTVTSRATSRRSCGANWKIAQEAFCESYHAPTTHPQTAGLSRRRQQPDRHLGQLRPGDHSRRHAEPAAQGGSRPRRRSCGTCSTSATTRRATSRSPTDKTAREVSAAAARERWRPVVGDMVDEWSDSEFIDNIDYTVFPNIHPWGGLQPHRVPLPSQRRQPPRSDHGRVSCWPRSAASARRRPRRRTSAPTTNGSTAPELGMLAKVFSQDSFNMPMVQKGLEATAKPGRDAGQLPGIEGALVARQLGRVGG